LGVDPLLRVLERAVGVWLAAAYADDISAAFRSIHGLVTAQVCISSFGKVSGVYVGYSDRHRVDWVGEGRLTDDESVKLGVPWVANVAEGAWTAPGKVWLPSGEKWKASEGPPGKIKVVTVMADPLTEEQKLVMAVTPWGADTVKEAAILLGVPVSGRRRRAALPLIPSFSVWGLIHFSEY
jgi:hypothetical protein